MKIPRTLTHDEERRLLKITEKGNFRDHVILLLALKTGLRSHEICALTVGDVFDLDGNVRRALQLRTFKGDGRGKATEDQVVWLSNETLRDKLTRFHKEKRRDQQSLSPAAPLFVSRGGGRKTNRKANVAELSTHAMLSMFKRWQEAAGFDRTFRFHDLRHTACTNCYEKSGLIVAVQKFARHASITSTVIYTHVSDDYMANIVRDL